MYALQHSIHKRLTVTLITVDKCRCNNDTDPCSQRCRRVLAPSLLPESLLLSPNLISEHGLHRPIRCSQVCNPDKPGPDNEDVPARIKPEKHSHIILKTCYLNR